ncbi:SDR family oxidoreductase [Rhodobacteraceae bacterium NNCM2]|nr:SDR family oxidoreductase [Coraliihabitans acroporae]
MNQIDLKGRKAVVTGGAQGIGRAIAERFIASGAFVTIWDHDRALSEQTCEALGDQSSHITVDLTDWDAVRSAAARSRAEMDRIDILVNNAGIAGANATVAETDPAEWRRVIDLDLNGVFYGCKAVVPMMIEQGYGRIVSTASIAGKEGNPNAAHYSAAKAGVIALTKSLGKELAGHDISVNCITPAAAKTAIFDQLAQSHIDFMLSKIPRGRFVTVEECAAMVAWLASEENSFTTGGVFDLSGGRATY